MNDIERIDHMISILRDMKKDITRQQKLSAVNSLELTPTQAQKRNTDLNWIGMEQIKRRHNLHSYAVELGIADHKGSDGYEKIELTDGWHRFNFQPRKPFS
ncbi:regulator [Proteus mirabilis]|uniref:regulator n=1 Tax=Proteus mirabilis TaxID=584 RepID=UPI0029BFDEFC|nr:regulator [Proteus mirabilis]MDX4949377.1 regulator [Proteus mirabilis]